MNELTLQDYKDIDTSLQCEINIRNLELEEMLINECTNNKKEMDYHSERIAKCKAIKAKLKIIVKQFLN